MLYLCEIQCDSVRSSYVWARSGEIQRDHWETTGYRRFWEVRRGWRPREVRMGPHSLDSIRNPVRHRNILTSTARHPFRIIEKRQATEGFGGSGAAGGLARCAWGHILRIPLEILKVMGIFWNPPRGTLSESLKNDRLQKVLGGLAGLAASRGAHGVTFSGFHQKS